jgi:osmotically-inducible protein OsmY
MSKHKAIYSLAFALGAAAVLAGCATHSGCGFEGCAGDSGLGKSVQQNINQHPEFGAPDSIKVVAIDHVIYLNGVVDGGLERRTAESVARQVPGVTGVVNNIVVTH